MTQIDEVESIARELADELRRLYGPKLHELILYGSWARGDARPDSDIDFLVVLDSFEDYITELRRLVKVSSALTMKYNIYVSTQPISLEEYSQGRESFVLEVQKEGKRVA